MSNKDQENIEPNRRNNEATSRTDIKQPKPKPILENLRPPSSLETSINSLIGTISTARSRSNNSGKTLKPKRHIKKNRRKPSRG